MDFYYQYWEWLHDYGELRYPHVPNDIAEKLIADGFGIHVGDKIKYTGKLWCPVIERTTPAPVPRRKPTRKRPQKTYRPYAPKKTKQSTEPPRVVYVPKNKTEIGCWLAANTIGWLLMLAAAYGCWHFYKANKELQSKVVALSASVDSLNNIKEQNATNTEVPAAALLTTAKASNEPMVWICSSSGSYAYHRSKSCGALTRCNYEIKQVPLSVATNLMGRSPCGKCY